MMDDYPVKGDRPLRHKDEDALGFKEIASRIAVALVDHAADDGLVVGLEGPWGSGKSSLMFLIEEELKGMPDDERPAIINFRPWLVGNRDALIGNLFSELSKEIDRMALNAGDATRITAARVKDASEALRKFAVGLGRVGAAIEIAGDAVAVAPVKWTGKLFSAAGKAAGQKKEGPQLADLKHNLVKALGKLGKRIIVTIDDIDRLDPDEVMEVLRLARSVADFPNVIYVLCYDIKVLSNSVRKAFQVEDGRAYLEKIIQLTVMVPSPEAFKLRQWFSDELHAFASPRDRSQLERLKTVIDYEGGRQLTTPRSVVRTLDAIRFFWPPLREAKADLPDLVWLQLIKDGNAELYRWIESYCSTAAVLSLGMARVEDIERSQEVEKLIGIVPKNYFSDPIYREYFSDHLYGMRSDFTDEDSGFEIHQSVSEEEKLELIRDSRLASPDHYRLYFALIGPSHALTSGNVESLLSAADDGKAETITSLLALHGELISGSLGKADLLLERLTDAKTDALNATRSRNLLLAFADALDDAFRLRPFDQFWVNSLWDRADKLLPKMLSELEPSDRSTVVVQMFEEGRAIGWLTNLLRRETFAHGRFGSRQRPEADWWLTDAELDVATTALVTRYKSMAAEDIFSGIDPLSLLFAWLQAGDEAGPRSLVESAIKTDEGLVSTLEAMRTEINSSDRGKLRVLKRDNLMPFLDYDAASQRIEALVGDKVLGDRAAILSEALSEGSDY